MSQFFQFEADFVDALRCIPMQVRYKLDTCGVKLKLHQWNKFDEQERQQLVDKPCNTEAEADEYRLFLHGLIRSRTGEEATDLPVDLHPDWNNETHIPDSVQAKATEISAPIDIAQWKALTSLQRFALIKLSRSGHENSNFSPAMKEFQLL